MDGHYMDRLPQRKNLRLKDYDYSQAGYYFVTICSIDKKNFFWNVGDTLGLPLSTPFLSDIGKLVDNEINKIYSFYNNVEIDNYVIMPNHIHIVIILHNEKGMSKTSPTISRIVKQFKGSIIKQIGLSLWQKSFYEHIIRNQEDYEKICEYISTNPLKWEEDKYYI